MSDQHSPSSKQQLMVQALREEGRREREQRPSNQDYTLDGIISSLRFIADDFERKPLGSARCAVVREAIAWLDDCRPFLKDGETPAMCIERNRHDVDQALNLLVIEKRKNARAADEPKPQASKQACEHFQCVGPGSYLPVQSAHTQWQNCPWCEIARLKRELAWAMGAAGTGVERHADEPAAIPPSTQSKSDAQIAAELQTNMDAMIEPTDERERQCYRRLIRIMARARNRLQQIADAQSTAEPPTASREQQLLTELAYWKARCGVMHGDETNAVTKSEIPTAAQSAANSGQCESRKAAQSGTAAGASDETSEGQEK